MSYFFEHELCIDQAYARMLMGQQISSSTIYDLAANVVLFAELCPAVTSRVQAHRHMRYYLAGLLLETNGEKSIQEVFATVCTSEYVDPDVLSRANVSLRSYGKLRCRPRAHMLDTFEI